MDYFISEIKEKSIKITDLHDLILWANVLHVHNRIKDSEDYLMKYSTSYLILSPD